MKKINKFTDNCDKLEFGSYILFQKYTHKNYDNNNVTYSFEISKPILAIYLGNFVADQALGFNYVKWNNDKRIVYITNEHVINYPVLKEVEEVENHIEWYDYIDILGIWKNKPDWKQILSKYRKQNNENVIFEDEIEF